MRLRRLLFVLIAVVAQGLPGCDRGSSLSAMRSDGIVLRPSVLRVSWDEQSSLKQTRAVEVENHLAREVNLVSVRTTCGCSVATLPANSVLDPGATTTLPIDVTLPAIGVKNATVILTLFDQQSWVIRLPVILEGRKLETPYAAEWPDHMRVTGQVPGEVKSCDFIVRTSEARTDEPWLRGLSAPDGSEIAPSSREVHDGIADDDVACEYRFKVDVRIPTAAEQRRVDRLTANISREGTRPLAPIDIMAEYVPPFFSTPTEVFISAENESRLPVKRKIFIHGLLEEDAVVDVSIPQTPWFQFGSFQRLQSAVDSPVAGFVEIELKHWPDEGASSIAVDRLQVTIRRGAEEFVVDTPLTIARVN